jgi:molecular chaperone GrpE
MADHNTDTAASDAALESALADQKIAELESQFREASERALRSHAELENYRKRAQRELAEERRYAVVPLVRDLLPVVDNLERAIDVIQTGNAGGGNASSPADSTSSLLEGVKLVATQLDNVLKSHQCVRIETVGQPFDPNQHEAIAQEPSSEFPAGTVTRAVQAGYKLYDRVIRPAQVFVSTGKAAG